MNRFNRLFLAVVAIVVLCNFSFSAMGFDEGTFLYGTGENDTENNSISQDHLRASRSTLQGLQFYGSFENQLSLMVLKDGDNRHHKHMYDYLQLRLDMDAELAGGIKLRSDVVTRVFAGDTVIALSQILPPGTIQNALAADARLAEILQTPYAFENRTYLDNAYVKIPVGDFLFTVGKQPLGQGAGYVWNPTDVFTQKEMLDPTYQKEGTISAKLFVPMAVASLEMVAAPDGAFRNWTAGGRFSFPVGSLQFSVVSYYTRVPISDVEQSMDAIGTAVRNGQDPEEAILKTNHKRLMMGGDMVVDIRGVRLWAEGAYNYLPSGADWLEAEGGFDYYFPFETHLMVEYFYYERGPATQGGSYNLNSWMNVLDGNLKMLGRHFAFESIEHPVANFWSVGLSSFQALSDGSAMVEADVKWDFVEDAQLWLMAAKGLGSREDFLSNSFQSWLRLKFFF